MAERTIPLRMSDFDHAEKCCCEKASLAAEIERLRAALRSIAYGNPLHNEADLMRIARAALDYRKMEGRT